MTSLIVNFPFISSNILAALLVSYNTPAVSSKIIVGDRGKRIVLTIGEFLQQ
jgi:hypothetical protein